MELKDHLFLHANKKKVKVLFDEILYIESQLEYIKIVTTRRTFLSKMGTREIESLLPASRFRRIHRSYIVSLNKIDSYNADSVDVAGISIPVGRSYRDQLDNL
jgi:DNA-binding LytR/AlgR family response regulator